MSYDPNYVKWVQRSLNRLFKKKLDINGVREGNTPYIKALEEFKQTNFIEEAGLTAEQIGPKCQDKIIELNNLGTDGGDYIDWICKVLPNAPPQASSVVTDPKLKSAVRKFQGDEKLNVDGWVGYKTESRLIQKFKVEPPGTKPDDTPKGGGLPNPWVQWFNSLPPAKRYVHMMEIAAKDFAQGPWDSRLKCLAQKMRGLDKMGRAKNFFYFTKFKVDLLLSGGYLKLDGLLKDAIIGSAYYEANNAKVQTIIVQNYMDSTQARLNQYYAYPISSMDHYNQNFAKFFDEVRKIHLAVDAGIGEVGYYRGQTHGDPTMSLAQNIISGLSKTNYHIYNCYKDQMPGGVWDLEWLW